MTSNTDLFGQEYAVARIDLERVADMVYKSILVFDSGYVDTFRISDRDFDNYQLVNSYYLKCSVNTFRCEIIIDPHQCLNVNFLLRSVITVAVLHGNGFIRSYKQE